MRLQHCPFHSWLVLSAIVVVGRGTAKQRTPKRRTRWIKTKRIDDDLPADGIWFVFGMPTARKTQWKKQHETKVETSRAELTHT